MTFTNKITWTNVFSFFKFFSTNKCFVLFELIFSLILASLPSKSVFVTKFARANLASKSLAANLLNFEVAKNSSCIWSVSVVSFSLIFVLSSGFLLNY